MTPVTTTIRLSDEVISMFNSRDAMRRIAERDLASLVAPADVNFDFTGIGFLSRSAAHELLLIQDELRVRHIEAAFINTEQDVGDMIRTVAANRALPRRHVPLKPIHHTAENFF